MLISRPMYSDFNLLGQVHLEISLDTDPCNCITFAFSLTAHFSTMKLGRSQEGILDVGKSRAPGLIGQWRWRWRWADTRTRVRWWSQTVGRRVSVAGMVGISWSSNDGAAVASSAAWHISTRASAVGVIVGMRHRYLPDTSRKDIQEWNTGLGNTRGYNSLAIKVPQLFVATNSCSGCSYKKLYGIL